MSTNNEIIALVKADPMVIRVQEQLNEILAIKQAVFQKGVHFGPPYKNAKNDTLLKPGATFLQQKYDLHELHERLETTIHVDPTDLSKSYIIIQDRCRIFNSHGVELAQADAACTTFEDKYLYRGGGGKVCPTCGGSVMKSKYADRQTGDMGWYCKDCKANFHSTDKAITEQDTTKSVNTNPLNLLDTIVAMAQKRASVRSTIKATGVDALFSPGDGVTVDFYDDVFDGDDLSKAGEQLIQVVAKNAVISNENAQMPIAAGQNVTVIDQPQSSAETAKARLNGNGAPANGEKKAIGKESKNAAPSWKTEIGKVKNAVLSMYDHPKHMEASIAKLERDGKLTDDMNTDLAIRVITSHKDETEAPF